MIEDQRISVVTPTLSRPDEVSGLIENLCEQTLLPLELILVDGAPPEELRTQLVVENWPSLLPFQIHYIRHSGGTAIQRNVGIEVAKGSFIAFIDDDIRLEKDFFEQILRVFEQYEQDRVGGIAGYITNQYLDANTSPRWKWYRRLGLFTIYEPGRFDFETGYPINRYLQPPYEGIRELDFMGSGCVVWRKTVFENGLRFSEFFIGFGIMEDAHLSLRASRQWKLLECGRARCVHLHSPLAREDSRQIARKSATNYRYLFVDIVPNRTWKNEFRFWRVQFFDLFRYLITALQSPQREAWLAVLGKIEGIRAAWKIKPKDNQRN